MSKFRTLSIIIPTFNESGTIGLILERITKADTLGLKKQIIVVDDGSTDKTVSLIKNDKRIFKLVVHRNNQGKGAAIRSALRHSTGDVILIQDADLEYDPNEYQLLLEPIISGKADVVYGSRFMGGRPHRVVFFWHALMNNFLTTLSNMFTNINLSDMETCYKAFRGDLLRQIAGDLVSNRFGFEPEITARISRIPKVRFYEVGISYYGRTYQDGKHIGWLDGLKAVFEIIRFNLFH
jgi:glycosyltransferase involved in cell wall biosynthesis